MGVADHSVEDAAQQVLVVFSRRVKDVARGAERAFLFSTAYRIASDFRKRPSLNREVNDDEAYFSAPAPGPDAEGRLAHAEALQCLDRVLDRLEPDHRAVFVLADLEEMTMAQIAELLGIPSGTVASRLRRARELFETHAEEFKARFDEGASR
jgi:RNA polymerase sigma-70 factor (ECF subfamily)